MFQMIHNLCVPDICLFVFPSAILSFAQSDSSVLTCTTPAADCLLATRLTCEFSLSTLWVSRRSLPLSRCVKIFCLAFVLGIIYYKAAAHFFFPPFIPPGCFKNSHTKNRSSSPDLITESKRDFLYLRQSAVL